MKLLIIENLERDFRCKFQLYKCPTLNEIFSKAGTVLPTHYDCAFTWPDFTAALSSFGE